MNKNKIFEPWLFTTDIALAKQAENAGVKGIIIDWENLYKEARQAGKDFECNHDTLEDLKNIRKTVDCKVICRINPFGKQTKEEVKKAVLAGADIIFLPWVKTVKEVIEFLKILNNQAIPAVLIETKEALAIAKELAELPLEYIYVGLNDLSISRKTKNIFESVADGTVDYLGNIFKNHNFGFGGLTLIGKGYPVPFNLLFAEMVRLNCNFGFMRRSFKKDIIGKDMKDEINKINNNYYQLQLRTLDQINKDTTLFKSIINKIP